MKSSTKAILPRGLDHGRATLKRAAIPLLVIPVFLVLLPEAIGKPPVITPSVELQHTAVDIGQPHTFRVTATGGGLSYQWRLDGDDLPGETTEWLTFDAVERSDEGDYTVEVTNAEGSVVSESVRLWVVPVAADCIKGNYYNSSNERLPYFYLLPEDYDSRRSYPLCCLFHGSPGDETCITTPNYGLIGYANYPEVKTPASYRQQQSDPVILLWPVRRAGDSSWTNSYLQLVSSFLDNLPRTFNVDAGRVFVCAASEGVHAAWDLIAMRPGFFAGAIVASGYQGSAPPASVKDMPSWAFVAADDHRLVDMRSLVRALREAGGNPIYTEYDSGGHLRGIMMALSTPTVIDWILAQRCGVPSTVEPLLSITSPTPEATVTTGAASIDLAGCAEALGQTVSAVAWENLANGARGSAVGTNTWAVTGVPLLADRTNTVIVTGTTTTWRPAIGGTTTFNDTVSIVSSPIQATLALEGADAVLNWTGGSGPFEIQNASDLTGGDWSTILTDAMPPVTLPVEGHAQFFRVMGY